MITLKVSGGFSWSRRTFKAHPQTCYPKSYIRSPYSWVWSIAIKIFSRTSDDDFGNMEVLNEQVYMIFSMNDKMLFWVRFGWRWNGTSRYVCPRSLRGRCIHTTWRNHFTRGFGNVWWFYCWIDSTSRNFGPIRNYHATRKFWLRILPRASPTKGVGNIPDILALFRLYGLSPSKSFWGN